MLRGHSRGLQRQFLLHRNTCTQDLAFSNAGGLKASSKSGRRGTSKVWQGEGGKITKWGFTAVLSHVTQTFVAREHRDLLGCRWVVLFLLAPTGLADATDYARGGQK